MSLESFIPEVWSARLIASLKKTLVYAQPGVVNRDYEGDIQGVGDTVRISSIGPVTINNYAKNTDIDPPQELSDAQALLEITQQKYYNFQVDDVDKAQQKPKVMDAAMTQASYNLSNVADAYVAAQYVDADVSNNIGSTGSPVTPSATTMYEYIVDASVKLTEANVPLDNRWIILPPWAVGLMAKDNRFVSGATPGALTNITNGVSGKISNFTVLMSNNVPNTAGTLYRIMYGTDGAISYAEQIRKTEGYRPEKRFADAIKGLHLYGARVIRPDMLGVMTANRPS